MRLALQAMTTPDWLHKCPPRAVSLMVPMPPRKVPNLAKPHTDEDTRLSYFAQSLATRGGVVAPFRRGA